MRPPDEAAVVALVRAAAEQGRRLKVVGAAHSWSDIAMSDGTLVDLEGLARVVRIDAASRTVTVEPGLRLSRLNEALAAAGLALPVVGSIAAQTVGGLLSTATHGSSLRWGNLSSLVAHLRLVTGEGRVLELGEDDERLEGARVGLGALGVLTEVTLRVVPAFRLAEEISVTGFAEAGEQLLEQARAEEYVKWFWLPHTDRVACFRYRRVEGGGEPSALARVVDEKLVNGVLFAAILRLGGAFPGLIPPLNRAVGRAYFRPGIRTGRSDRVLTLPMPPRHRETEWSVPADEGPQALAGLREVIEDAGLRVNFIQEVRFVRGDGGWLSPAHGRDSCHVGAYCGHGRDGARLVDLFCARMRGLGARPHWGKELDATPDYLARVYPCFERFRALRRTLDPAGVFDNAFLRRTIGDAPDLR